MKKSFLLKALFATLLLTILPPPSAFAYDFSAVNDEGTTIYYNITSSGKKTVEVTAKEYYSTSNSSAYTGNVVIPETVEYNGITYSVTGIGNYAFYHCESLTSIKIPSSVTSIGSYAFESCLSLTSIEIPSSVTSIGSYAFESCLSLTSIEIPSSVTSIGGGAFWCCTSLTSIEIPSSVTSIGNSAFYNCTSLTSIEIPSSVTSIGEGAFESCSSLTSIEIPSGVTSIEDYTFYQCSSLTSIEIPSSVTSIGRDAFRDCTSLTSIKIPSGVTSIGTETFYNCTSLTSIEIPNSVTSIGVWAFVSCTSLTSIEIPSSVTSIGNAAFWCCTSLTSIEIPSSVTSIEYEAFSGCTSLTSIEIPNSVTSIGNSAFYNCTSLTSIEIPSSVTSIGSYAFAYCTGLTHITSLNPEPPECTSTTFNSVDKTTCLLSVPVGAKEAYASADVWKEFTNIEEEGEETSSFTYDGNSTIDPDYFTKHNITELIISEDVVTLPEAFNLLTTLETVYYNAVSAGIEEALEILQSIFANCPNLKTFVFGDKVKTIPDYLLKDCVGLETIELPSGIESIGKGAFEGCTGLREIIGFGNLNITALPDNVFHGCTGLESIELPSGIKEIGTGIFEGCTSLKEVKGFGSLKITVIPDNTFNGCTALESIEIPSGVTSIGNYAFYYCEKITTIEITNNITIIGDYAFGGCSSLSSLIYNAKNVGSFGENVFSGCPITSLTIGEDVEYVPMDLNQLTDVTIVYYNAVNAEFALSAETLTSIFAYFKNLTTFVIGETVKTIVDYVLKNCVGIVSIELPSGITSIGKGVFDGCTSLREVRGFGNMGIMALPDDIFHGCTALESIELPDGIKEIGTGVFEGCTSLKSVGGFGNLGITTVPDNMFHGCIALEQIEIPGGVTGIGDYAFAGDDTPMGLKSITFGDGSQLKSIGNFAFYYCEKITTFEITNYITIIGSNAFGKCSNLAELIYNAKNSESFSPDVFSGCPITSLTIGEDVETIPAELDQLDGVTKVYYNAVNVESALSAETLNSIFAGFKSLTTFVIGETVKRVADYLLKNCPGITSIELPDGIEGIGEGAFQGCTGIESIELPGGIKEIGTGVFEGCTSLKEIKGFGSLGITTVPDYMFHGCVALEQIEIPGGVTGIGDYAFAGDDTPMGLKSITFGDGSQLKSIGNFSFYYCEKITTFEITNYITIVGSNAFGKCSNLAELIYNAKNSESFSPDVFSGCPITSLTIGEDVETIPAELDQLDGVTKVYYNAVNVGSALSAETLNSIFAGFKSLTTFVIGETVKRVADYLLKDCPGITSIELPSGIESIGEGAFHGCTGIESIELPGGIKEIGTGVFEGCTSLKEIKGFGSLGITTVPDNMFHGCVALEQIEIPGGVTGIGDYAFAGDDTPMGLKSITFGEGSQLKSIGNFAFYYCEKITTFEITNYITIIGSNAFGKCSNLAELIYNAKNSESFSPDVFSGCPITSLTIGEDVETIPAELDQLDGVTKVYYNAVNVESALSAETLNSIFAGFKSLTTFVIGETVKRVADYLLKNCPGITSIELPDGIEGIGEGAFQGCTGIESIELPGGIKEMGTGVFEGCTSLKSVGGFGNLGITTVPDYMFHGCIALEQIEIPGGVTGIGDYAFAGDDTPMGLKSITFGDGSQLKSIGNFAFYYCEGITKFEITNYITIIGSNAFGKCSNLAELIYNAKNNESFSPDVFSGCPITSLTIGEDVETIPAELDQLDGVTKVYYNAVNVESALSVETLNSIFAGFKSLTTFVIGETVKRVADYLLKNCPGITSIELPGSIEGIGEGAFQGCTGIESIELPGGIKEIGMGVFEGCTSLKSVGGFGNLGITTVPDNIFHGCIALEQIEIPSGVTGIGDYAFAGDDTPMGLKSITFGEGSQLKSIGNFAFYYCEKITTFEITNYITIIGSNAFGKCSNLAELIYNAKNSESFSPDVFSGCPITSLTIGEDVETIPAELDQLDGVTKVYYNAVNVGSVLSAETLNSIFAGFKSLTTFVIGETVKRVADYLLKNCPGITSIELPDGIESVGEGAFQGCTGIESIELPGGIKEIGTGVFEGCTSLKSVGGFGNLGITTVPDNMFHGCVALEQIEIPSGVTGIGDYAFAGDDTPMGLKSITFGDGSQLKSIGNFAFYYCEGITTFEITNYITIIGSNAFGKCSNLAELIYNAKNNESFSPDVFSGCPITSLTIGEDVETIPAELDQLDGVTKVYFNAVNVESALSAETFNSIFAGFKSLTTFVIGETVKRVADYLLKNCPGITSIELPSGIESVGEGAFQGCTGIESIELPDGIKEIGTGVFEGCTNLKSVGGFGELGITALPDDIFHGCTAIESIELPGGIERMGTGIFDGCTSLKEIKGFGSLGITAIPDYMFHGCTALEQIGLPGGVMSIGSHAFNDCTSLTEVNGFSDLDLENICEYSFAGCSRLSSIKLPNTVTSIGSGAFADCTGLSEIYSTATKPASCEGDDVFKGVPGTCTLYVPAGIEKEYGEYGSGYANTWNSLSRIRTFHLLDIVMKEDPDVESNIAGYGYATFFNGKYTYDLPAGMKAAVVTSSASGFSDWDVPTMCWNYDGDDQAKAVVPANTAVVIYGNMDENMLMVDYDEKATGADKYGVISSDGNVPDVNLLHGCWDTDELYTDDTYTEGVTYAYSESGEKTVEDYLFYMLDYDSESDGVCSNIGFYWAEDEGKPFPIAAKEVWLALPSSTDAPGYIGIAYGDDTPITGLQTIETGGSGQFSVNDGRIYNLAGQRVSNMNQRGIYIINGKKVAKK